MTAQPGLHYGEVRFAQAHVPSVLSQNPATVGFALVPAGDGPASPYGAWGSMSAIPGAHYSGNYGIAFTLRQRITHLEAKLAKLRAKQRRYFRAGRKAKIAELAAKLRSLKQRLAAKEKRRRQRQAGRDVPIADDLFDSDLASLEQEFLGEDIGIDPYETGAMAETGEGGSPLVPILVIGLGGLAVIGAIYYLRKRTRGK